MNHDPLDSYQILERAFALYKKSFGPVFILSLLGALCWLEPEFFLNSSQQSFSVKTFLWTIPAWIGAFFFWIALVIRIYGIMHIFDYDLTQSLILSLKRLIPTLIVSLLYIVIVLCASMLLIIPGLILAVTLMFSFFLIITNKSGMVQSLVQSHRLVWGHVWRTSAIISVPIMVHFALSLVSYLVIIKLAPNIKQMLILFNLVQAGLQVLILPYLFSVGLCLLQDLEFRLNSKNLL